MRYAGGSLPERHGSGLPAGIERTNLDTPRDVRRLRLAATERGAAASERVASGFSGGFFGANAAKEITTAIRTATGVRGFMLSSGR